MDFAHAATTQRDSLQRETGDGSVHAPKDLMWSRAGRRFTFTADRVATSTPLPVSHAQQYAETSGGGG
jgi:hypothetical protein